MGTWIKETDQAVYLMDGGQYIDAVLKRPSLTNPQEQVANIEALKAWFQRDDKPQRMTVSVGIDAPEPQPIDDASSVSVPPPMVAPPEPETPMPPEPLPVVPERPGGDQSIPSSHGGMQIRTLIDTFFKLSLKDSSQLTDKEKVLVESGTVFDIEYYTDVGSNHWLVELLTPTLGDRQTTSWYVFAPSIELLTDTTLTVVSDTLFKQE
ncbi:MAG: peptidase M15 family protein, partial [Cyanobacteria bacterium J06607_6]